MSAGTTTDLAAFAEYISHHLGDPSPPTPEEAVVAFREYQEQRERFLRESREAFEQSRRGECSPLDRDEFNRQMVQELAKKGIVED